MARPLDDFLSVVRRLFGFLKYLSVAMLLLTLWFIVREVWSIRLFLDGIHPALGWAFLAVAAALLVRLLGVPAWRFFRMPATISPPALPETAEGWTPEHLRKRIAYLHRTLSLLAANPRLAESGDAIGAARRSLTELAGRLAGKADAADAGRALSEFETKTVEPLLAPLDREVDKVIRAEALGVGVATAISPNGTLDSFIVLWRNANLVSRIANVYYGRPGVRGSLTILRDVSGAALLATYLEGLSEAAAGVLRGFLGSIAGVVAGPLVDGGVNALATLRIGYLAKGRCRSFRAWTDETRKAALKEALAAARDRSGEVLADLVKRTGGSVAGVTGKMSDAAKGAWSSFLKKVRGEGEPGSPPPAPAG